MLLTTAALRAGVSAALASTVQSAAHVLSALDVVAAGPAAAMNLCSSNTQVPILRGGVGADNGKVFRAQVRARNAGG
jgi:hypothetical protein